jgi:N6-L-threonylcarbamoyladenine synthase
MKILAIETSCDETAAAVVENGVKVLSNEIYSQAEEHRLYGGVVPEIASRRHAEQIVPVTRSALLRASVALSDIDAVAVTYAPGLIGALLGGLNFAKGLGLAADKPLIAVPHIHGHVAANYIAFPGLAPPFLCLIVSGGHSHIVEVLDRTAFRVVGRTRDDAAGEAFDKAARVLGLPYPGGAEIEKAAANGDAFSYKLPSPKVEGSPYDFSFSGLKTAVVNLAHNTRQQGRELARTEIENIAASFQATVCETLAARFMLAARELGYKKLVLAGGVSANSALREKLKAEAAQTACARYMPPLALCTDNAAMIGAQGYFEYMAGNIAGYGVNAEATKVINN